MEEKSRAKREQVKKILGELTEMKTVKRGKHEDNREKLIRTAKSVGKDVAIGVVGGGLAAALLGRYSFLAGLGFSGYGHYNENPSVSAFGLGMMASSSMSMLNGNKMNKDLPASEQMLQRVKAFGEELKRKVFLDKLVAPEKANVLNGVAAQGDTPAKSSWLKVEPPAESDFQFSEIPTAKSVAARNGEVSNDNYDVLEDEAEFDFTSRIY